MDCEEEMSDIYDTLRQAVRTVIGATEKPLLHKVMQAVNSELECLCEQGAISIGNDYSLAGLGLECRVKEVFHRAGFEIKRGRDGMEDFIVDAPPDAKPSTPLVLEAKSSRKPHVGRDELRQLDDWVFELSGEQEARKYGLGGKGGPDYLAFASWGLLSRQSQRVFHPTPHKGVLIFNGPIEHPFSKRASDCIGPNDRDFVDKRNFCVIPFQVLLDYCKRCLGDPQRMHQLWTLIHGTGGTLGASGVEDSLTS
jgi:hypothetical protein